MCTVDYASLHACRHTLHECGFKPTGCNGHHGHGNTVWTNGFGERAEITLDKCTGCFVLFCSLSHTHNATKEKLHVTL